MSGASAMNRKTFESPAVRVVDIDAVEIGGGLHAFRTVSRFEKVAADGVREAASGDTRQGLVDDENLELLMANEPYEVFLPYQVLDGRRLVPVMAAAEVLHVARTEGNPVTYTKIYNRLTSEKKFLVPNKYPLVDAAVDGMGVENVLFLAMDDHGLVDVRGRPIPQAMRFDYMEGGFDEENYDLEALAQALSENPEIEIVTEGRRNSLVTPIPYYNAREGREEQVQFLWRPTDESWSDLLSRHGFDAETPRHIRLRPETIIGELDFFNTSHFRRDAASSLTA